MVITTMLRHLKEYGLPLLISQWTLFTENIWELLVSEGFLAASTVLCLPLHLLYAKSKGPFRWHYGGMGVQVLFQSVWLSFWVVWPFLRNWTWTAQVFFTLHILTLAMKMHSYAFYNGHLSETRRRLQELDQPETASKAAAIRYPSAISGLAEVKDNSDMDSEDSSSGDTVCQLRDELATELTSPVGRVTYPQNLTVLNFVDFLFCPTLCYELEYPRTDGIVWSELYYKTLAVFGCIFLLTVTSEEFIIPVLAESGPRMQGTPSQSERALILAETISRLLFPFMIAFLLVFLVIFEYACGAFAEITCTFPPQHVKLAPRLSNHPTGFADRHFYSDWWNSCDWLEFSREWNIPVHNFFRRHVYSASRGHLSRPVATVITFFISAIAHELVMFCITKKLRGYGFFAMMLQMPIVMAQRSRWLRGRTLLNVR